MRLLAGTSGFAYKEWRGRFYPEKLPESDFLTYYAERLPTVEINNTFYRLPKASVLDGWAQRVPAGFTFILKASRAITHLRRLKPEAAEPLGYLLAAASRLGESLGPLLFQLPPNMKKDLPRLEAFLELLPEDRPAAFEFRHPTWFEDDVYAALRAHRRALCIAHTEEGETPFVATADWGYLRLRNVRYAEDELRAWIERVLAQPWSHAYVFFKHEDEATGPHLATRFLELAAQADT